MRKYFWRQFSSQWFDRYLTLCGIVLNLLALISIAGTLIPRPAEKKARIANRARIELENAQRCDQLMANTEFAPGRGFTVQLTDGTAATLSYNHQGTHSRTSEGHSINMVELKPAGFLFFEVDDRNLIRRCIPSEQLECVAANGSFEKNGDCILSVNLPSDCEVMKGTINGNLCRVPPHNRILKPVARSSSDTKICLGPDCAK